MNWQRCILGTNVFFDIRFYSLLWLICPLIANMIEHFRLWIQFVAKIYLFFVSVLSSVFFIKVVHKCSHTSVVLRRHWGETNTFYLTYLPWEIWIVCSICDIILNQLRLWTTNWYHFGSFCFIPCHKKIFYWRQCHSLPLWDI